MTGMGWNGIEVKRGGARMKVLSVFCDKVDLLFSVAFGIGKGIAAISQLLIDVFNGAAALLQGYCWRWNGLPRSEDNAERSGGNTCPKG